MPETVTRVGGPTETDLLEIVYTGKTAEELSAEPLLQRWWSDADTALAALLRDAILADNAADIAHYMALMRAQEFMRDTWRAYINSGKLAADTLRQLRDRKERVSRFKWGPRAAV